MNAPLPLFKTWVPTFPSKSHSCMRDFFLRMPGLIEHSWTKSDDVQRTLKIPLPSHYVFMHILSSSTFPVLIGESRESCCLYGSGFPLPCIGSSEGCSDSCDLSTHDKLVCKRGLVKDWHLQFVEERTTPEAWKFSSIEPLMSLLLSRFYKRSF